MKKILSTTTESLFGWEIENYIKPIFSNVVIGAGFLSDISAGFTDIFGGRSNSYEKKLQVVNEGAIKILESKAAEVGANCILGLKVNVNQISGKNVQMFMVSAYGTAVVAKSIVAVKSTESLKEIDKSTVNDKALLIDLLKGINSPGYIFRLNHIELIVESKSSEFKEFIYDKLKGQYLPYQVSDDISLNVQKLYVDYFGAIEPDMAIAVLYDALFKESNELLITKILSIIKAHDLVDFNAAVRFLKGVDLKKRRLGLRILSYNKPFYIMDDVLAIQGVINEIELAFPNVSSISTKKGFLSSNEKEVWVCSCGKSNDPSHSHCLYCDNDQFGFKSGELKPSSVANDLQNQILALKELFQVLN